MDDPEFAGVSNYERLTRGTITTRERHARVILPDLKTLVVVQDCEDVESVDELSLRTPRTACIDHKISLSGLLRVVRHEIVSVSIALHGLAPDDDDLHDPEALTRLRDELKIPSTKRILRILPIIADVPVHPSHFYFNEDGSLQARHHVGIFDSTFAFLTNSVGTTSSPTRSTITTR